MARALALVSGGLDSILAAKLIKDQGIDVIGICFKSAFFSEHNAIRMAKQIDMELKVVDFTHDHMKLVRDPKHGYGKNMNPCIDCHAMMMNYAGKLMKELDADFIITGEVLNQRPMSQTRKSLDIVKKESGFEEYILRPLCAKNLPPTKMELEGLVDREKLLGISGRSRKQQMELAEKWNIKDYPSPAGGCSLTEPGYAHRLKDLFDNENGTESDLRHVSMLKVGRHLRIDSESKVVATRNQDELSELLSLVDKDDLIFDTAECAGCTVILHGKKDDEKIAYAASVCARYSKQKDQESVAVKYKSMEDKTEKIIRVKPAADEDINKYLV